MGTQRFTAIGLLVLGAGLAVNAVLGPLVLGVMKLRVIASFNNQFIGGEVISLFLVAPLALAAGVLWFRGHRLAPLLALAAAIYTLYTVLTVVLGTDYAHQPGNNEQFFPLHWLLLVLSWVMIARAWSALEPAALSLPSDRLRQAAAGTLLLVATLIGLTWVRQVAAVLTGEAIPDYPEGATLFWLIRVLDLAFFVPLAYASGIALFRRQRSVLKPTYALTGFPTCELGAIAGMMMVTLAKGDPSAGGAVLATLLVAFGWMALITVALFRSYLLGTRAARRSSPPPNVAVPPLTGRPLSGR